MEMGSAPMAFAWGETPKGFTITLLVGQPGQQVPLHQFTLSDHEAGALSGVLDKYLMTKLGSPNGSVLHLPHGK
mgnify:CR=1 FL=1